MKIKNAVIFLLIIALIACGAVISVRGFSAGNIKIDPVQDRVKLGLDLKGGVFIVLEAQTDATGSELDRIMEQTKEVIQKRVDAMGLTEPNILREGRNRIRIELPGVENAQEAIEAVGKTAQLQFLKSDGQVILTGKQVKNAEVVFDNQMGNQPMVSLSLNSDGGKAFQEATREAASAPVGSPERIIAIVLDNEIISAPSVTEEIPNGQAVITGNFTLEEASQLAALIRGGALPVDLVEVQTSTIGPTLGMDSLTKSIHAGVIGIGLIFLFMLIYYRIPGLIADIALVLYIIIVIWVLIGFNAVLTLPGVAGLILSIGMAVDANVLIFERIKEEIRNGKSLRTSIDSGFSRALTAILDSNITTLIAGIVLFQFGSGPIRGFAVTLMIGIVSSMFTAVVVTRLLLKLFANLGILKNIKLYGA